VVNTLGVDEDANQDAAMSPPLAPLGDADDIRWRIV
jgi:hypothetical protein